MKKKFKTPAKCYKCFYSGPTNFIIDGKMLYSCDYFILTGARRPCPAGSACTVYSPRSKADRTIPTYTRLRRKK